MNREKENAFFSLNYQARAATTSQSWTDSNQHMLAASHGIKSSLAASMINPPLKEAAAKFSSWTSSADVEQKNGIIDQVDELLLYENESLNSTPSDGKPSSGGSFDVNKQARRSNTTGGAIHQQLAMTGLTIGHQQIKAGKDLQPIISPSSSLEFDSYDLVEDEMLKGFPLKQQLQNDYAIPSESIKYQQNRSRQDNEDLAGLGDSLDFENSDDLNKIISKYETLLGSKSKEQLHPTAKPQRPPSSQKSKKDQLSSLKQKLEESWGSKEKILEEIQQVKKTTTDEHYDDDFDEDDDNKLYRKEAGFDDDEDDKLVDEEFNLTSSGGSSGSKKDSDFLKELMKPPTRTRLQQAAKPPASHIKAVQDEGSEEDSDEIDDFIKKHIENEEKERLREIDKHAKRFSSTQHSDDSSESDVDPSEESAPKLTPKECLLECLKKLADSLSKYSLTDREMFLSDMEGILKVLSFKEIEGYLVPALEIYATEQEFLKLQFFQKVPHVFSRLLCGERMASRADSLKLLNSHLYPLISRLMCSSEEQVQSEGVDALVKISKESLKDDEVQRQMFDVVQLVMEEAEHNEGAKIAALMIVERFADIDVFKEQHCTKFLDLHLAEIQNGMLFKIKKFLLPTLIATSKHLTYDRFVQTVYSTYMKFAHDDIWGVRKVCLERLLDLVKFVQPNDAFKLRQCIDFLQSSLNDQSRWVRNQAFQLFGTVTNEIYLKTQAMESKSDAQQVRDDIRASYESFYDFKFIAVEEDAVQQASIMLQSFAASPNDDTDKIKYYWAYYLPCALALNEGQTYWEQKCKAVFSRLFKDLQLNVRKTLASSLHEVMKLINMVSQENQQFFLDVIRHFASDLDDIKAKIQPNLCTIVSLYPADQQQLLLNTLIKESIIQMPPSQKGPKRDNRMQLLEQLYDVFPALQLSELDFHNFLMEVIEQEQAIKLRKRASKVLGGKVVAQLIKSKRFRKPLTTFIDKLRLSKNFRDRQMYIVIGKATYIKDQEIFKKHFAKAIGTDMLTEKVKVVQAMLAKLCGIVPPGYSKSIDKVRASLQATMNEELLQFMDTQVESKTRYLINAESEQNQALEEEKSDAKSSYQRANMEMTQQEIEKSVTVRFANFTQLVRTANGESYFSSNLMALLGGSYGSSSEGEAGFLKKPGGERFDNSEEALLKTGGAASTAATEGISSWHT